MMVQEMISQHMDPRGTFRKVDLQKENASVAEKLNITNDVIKWVPVLEAYKESMDLVCPLCGSHNVTPNVSIYEGGIGFALFTCNGCDVSAWFSRVDFNSKR